MINWLLSEVNKHKSYLTSNVLILLEKRFNFKFIFCDLKLYKKNWNKVFVKNILLQPTIILFMPFESLNSCYFEIFNFYKYITIFCSIL